MEPLSGTDESVYAATSRPERFLTALAIAALALVCLSIVIAIFSRSIGQVWIPDDAQWVRQMMVGIIVFPLAMVTALRMHISVGIFVRWVPPAGQRVLEVVGNFAGIAFVGILLWAGLRLFLKSWQTDEFYDGDFDIPYWIGHGAYAAGLAVFWMRLWVQLWSDLMAFGAGTARQA